MNNNEWLDIDVLEDYLDGKLDAKAMHRVERLSLEDPFVAEALAGLSASPKRAQTLSLLQKQLQERIAQKPVEQKRWQITSQRLSIAAAAAVLFVTVSLLFWMRESSNREKIAANTPKKVEVVIAADNANEKAVVKSKSEVDQVVEEAKATTYANRSKSKTQTSQSATAEVMQTPNAVRSTVETKSLGELKSSASAMEILKKENYKKRWPTMNHAIAGLKGKNDRPRFAIVNGTVYGEDKTPIPGASVKVKGVELATVTDNKGEFSLKVDTLLKNSILNVAYLGFMPKEVPIKKDENVTVELKQNNASLNEVVIAGYGTVKKQMLTGSVANIVTGPEPVGGWDKFEEYVINNNALLADKKATGRLLTLFFKLNAKGEPINIKVASNADLVPKQTNAEEREAIRLLKNGPKWIIPVNSKLSDEISVSIQF